MDTDQLLRKRELIASLFSLQEKRAPLYKELEQGLQSTLESDCAGGCQHDHSNHVHTVQNQFVLLTQRITKEFVSISDGVVQLEKVFLSSGMTEIAQLVRNLQELERAKLQLTVETHLLRKDHSLNHESYVEFEEPMYKRVLREKKLHNTDITNQINDVLEQLKCLAVEG